MSELPGNSHNSKNQDRREPAPGKDEKKVEKIVKGEVTQRKKPLWRRTKELFFGGESKGVLGYVFEDVMIPAAQDLVADAAESAIRGAVYGQPSGGPPGRRRRNPGGGSYSYNGSSSKVDYQNRFREPRGREMSRRARSTHDMGEFVLESRVEGEEILDQMYALLERYDQVTVHDLYGMLGVSATYVDQKHGWTSLQGSTIRRERDGYILDLPRTEPLN